MSSDPAPYPYTRQHMPDKGTEMRALAAEFRPALERYFSRRVASSAEVEDLVHDTFVRLLRKPGNVDPVQARGYVFQTANSVMVDWLRRAETRARMHEEVEHRVENPVEEPERLTAGREDLALVARILGELPPRTRAVFLLRRLEGMKYEDIARRFGLSLSTVEKLMRRALTHLAERLKEHT